MSIRADYCPIGGQPCQSMCDTPCGTSAETRQLRAEVKAVKAERDALRKALHEQSRATPPQGSDGGGA